MMWSDFERTASRFGTKEWECLMCPSSEHKFVRCDDDKNATDSYFRVREPETEKMRCAFKDFARCATSWREKSILFDSEIYSMRHDEEDEEKETAGEETEAERFAPKTRRLGYIAPKGNSVTLDHGHGVSATLRSQTTLVLAL